MCKFLASVYLEPQGFTFIRTHAHTLPQGGAILIHLLFPVDFDVTFVGLPNVRPQTFPQERL